MRPKLLAVALVAGGALAFEVLLTRILAIVHWHHFAGMVISLALLGYGASGSVLTPWLERLRPHAAMAFAAAATLFGIAAVAIAQAVPFNALEVIWNPWQWLWLALLYLLFAVPFFFAASCTGLALACFTAPVGRVYRADLLGAGTGALAVVGLLSALRPDHALPLIATLGPAAGLIVLLQTRRHLATLAALAVIIVLIGLAAAGRPALRISPFKPLPQMLQIEGTGIIAERTSPIGLVQIVRSERIPLRAVTGLSLMNRQEPAPQLGLFIDAEGPTPITRFTGEFSPLAYLDATLTALPYRLLDRPDVLLLGLGGGADLLLALRHAARLVDVVEPDATVADLLRNGLAGFAGPILDRPEVRLHVDAARRFVLAANDAYDLIVLRPHAAGRGTLVANYATTVEAFTACLRRLASDGLLALPHPLRLPPRDSLKLVLIAIEALEGMGAAEPARHLALARAWDSALLLVRRTPFAADELARIDRFAEERAFDLGWHPAMPRAAADRFNLLGEPVLFDGVAALTGPDRSAFVADYAFDIRPATDDRPFFLDFFRWQALPALWAAARQGNAGLLDWGWPVQLATLGVAALSALVLILLPVRLLAGRTAGRLRRATAAYFLLIATGFMFIEIATIQRLVLLLGQPVYAFATALAAFLVFAGLGALPRFALVAVLVAPLAFAMGLPFPLVVARLRVAAPQLVPWAWAVNGCASVIAAILASVLAMSFGARSLIVLAVSAYALAALLQRDLPSAHRTAS